MKLSSFFPEHICKVLGAVVDPDDNAFHNHVHPKFIKWMTVARFKYDCQDEILQLAERFRTNGKFFYDGMTVDGEMVTIKYDFFCSFPSLFFLLITDYLESCDLHYHSLTVEQFDVFVCYIQFTFNQSPTQ